MTTPQTDPETDPQTETVIIDRSEKLPTQARQAGMIAHERGLLRYRAPEIHPPHGTVYRVNIPTARAVLADLLDEAGVPTAIREKIMTVAGDRYGPDTNVEAFIPEQGMVTAMWVLALHRYGVQGDAFLHIRDGMLDPDVPSTADDVD